MRLSSDMSPKIVATRSNLSNPTRPQFNAPTTTSTAAKTSIDFMLLDSVVSSFLSFTRRPHQASPTDMLYFEHVGGRITLSTTWITPLAAMMSVLTIVALFTRVGLVVRSVR